MPDSSEWVACQFTKQQLDGQQIFFCHPTINDMFLGHMHVEDNGQGKIRILIDYGGLDSSGQMQSGTFVANQTFANKLIQPGAYIVAPPYLYPPAVGQS